MAGESVDLDKLFESVADGESIDWDALEQAAPNDEALALIRQLRLIAEVSEVHRSQVDEIELGDEAAVTGPAAAGARPIQSRKRHVYPDVGTTPGGPPGRVPPGGVSPEPGGHLEAWGHLLLVRKVGEGSFGEVFQAHDTWLDHPVALKLLKFEAENWVPPAQLLHEARKLARVRHVNVVTVHGADRHNGRVGFWMDFVDGETLAARVGKGSLSAGEAASVGQEVCKALAAVHRANIIHRDVKAQNVMRAHDGGRIILMDFGAGEFVDAPKETRAQGTPLYLAPELLEGGEATVRSDIYACGVLLYHLVTSRFPVEGASLEAIRGAHARGERRRLRDARPDLPESFIAIVERAIDPNPARRYASAGEMEAKLNGEKTEPLPAPIPVPKPVIGPTFLDYGKWVVAVLVMLVAATVGFGFLASRAFQIILRIDPDFGPSFSGVLNVGLQAMIPFLLYGTFGAAVLGGIAGLRLLLRPLISTPWQRLMSFTNTWDPVVTAAGILLFAAASWVVINNVLFADLFAALYTLMDDPTTSADLSILGSAGHEMHLNHFYISFYLSMLLGVAVWRWFPALERRTTALSAVRGLKWGVVAVALTLLAFAVVPRRIIWERYPVVEFDNRSGLVIGSTGNEVLVYTPEEPGRPRRRVRQDAPGFQRTAETRLLFDRERQKQ
jgi:serine/threonine-protein kinase